MHVITCDQLSCLGATHGNERGQINLAQKTNPSPFTHAAQAHSLASNRKDLIVFENLLRSLLVVGVGLLLGMFVSFAAHAQCAPGTTMYYSPTNAYCGPDPNYRPPQQAPQRPAEVWQDRYGAMFVDVPKGALGAAGGKTSRLAAEQAALADCKARGGGMQADSLVPE